jgi:hypothetical protein
LPIVKNHPIGEKSPNLVTLRGSDKKTKGMEKIVANFFACKRANKPSIHTLKMLWVDDQKGNLFDTLCG